VLRRAARTVPGFAITRADRPEILTLEGRHRFSRYRLSFRLRADGRSTVVSAESRAAFPGAAGRAYRAVVVGSHRHVVAVRRMLARIAAAATATRCGCAGDRSRSR
jgi:hypothetical protein